MIYSGNEISNARNSAYRVLSDFQRNGGFSEDAVSDELKRATLSEKDRALCVRIFMGVVQNRDLIDFYIDSYSKSSKLQPQVRTILRIAIYQLLFLDKIPASAVVNEAVSQAKKLTNPQASAFVNALLRKISVSLDSLPELSGNDLEKLSVKYSHPKWFVEKISGLIGPVETEELLRENNSIPNVSIHVNTLKITLDELMTILAAEKIKTAPHPYFAGCLEIIEGGQFYKNKSFIDGLFTVQDVASKIVVTAAAPEPGFTIIDLCAAPGGKSVAAAIMMDNIGKIISLDKNNGKISLINDAAVRTGTKIIKSQISDATVYNPALLNCGDIVFADVPCSGFGVIRKKPEIRYKKQEDIKYLPDIQRKIIENAAKYVKPGGKLVYSTCTLFPEENEMVTSAFLERHSNFQPLGFMLEEPFGEIKSGELTLWPHIYNTDGFYIRIMRKLYD